MNDRFKFKFWDKEINQMRYGDVAIDNEGYPFVLIEQKKLTVIERLDNIIPLQSTGLKDKNGKLIYEGDIIKYAEFDWTDFSFKDWKTETAEVVWGNTYDNYYPAFDLKDTYFEGTNAFAHLFNEGWPVEVIGNKFENPELLKECE